MNNWTNTFDITIFKCLVKQKVQPFQSKARECSFPGLAIYRQIYFFKVSSEQVVFILDFVTWTKPWHNSKKIINSLLEMNTLSSDFLKSINFALSFYLRASKRTKLFKKWTQTQSISWYYELTWINQKLTKRIISTISWTKLLLERSSKWEKSEK